MENKLDTNVQKKRYHSALEMFGNTPIVRINNLIQKDGVNIYAKLEGYNPTGSIKDRIALKMIEQAEKEGVLTRDKTIIEPTSGNTGIGLALVGKQKGYKVEVVLSSAVSQERVKMIKAYGAGVIITDGKLGTDGAIMKATELVEKYPDKYFMPNQFSNKYNKIAHYKTTAEEIWNQMDGQVDYFVSSLGTSGTLMGVSNFLKEKDQNIKIVSAHPVKGHYIQGLKNMEEAIVPAIYDERKIDETVMVETSDAFDMTRKVMREEGISVGMSSGAAMVAALEIANKIDKGNIVLIFPDRAERYLSTDLFSN